MEAGKKETAYKDPQSGSEVTGSSRESGHLVYSEKLSRMVRNENSYFEATDTFYFIDNKGSIYKATNSSLRKLFPAQKDELQEYLDRVYIDFNAEGDLIGILAFLNQSWHCVFMLCESPYCGKGLPKPSWFG